MKGNVRSYKGEVADFSEPNANGYEIWDRRRIQQEEPQSADLDYHEAQEGEFYEEPRNMKLFLKVGMVVLSLLLIVGGGIYLIPRTVATISNSGRKLPIYCVNTDQPKIALSFDVAWGNEQTRSILDICTKHDIKVTFFMTGTWIEKYPESVKAIAAAGHELGNHSENHKQMSKLSKSQCVDELMKPHNRVKELTGLEMKVFRPPYGDYNNTLIEAATECNYHTIQWDVETLDTKRKCYFTGLSTII